jgi:hypothetical protein
LELFTEVITENFPESVDIWLNYLSFQSIVKK